MTAVSVHTDFFQSPPQNIPPFLTILSGTICIIIHDVSTELNKITADFSTSKLKMAKWSAECFVMDCMESNLYVKTAVITLPGF